MSEEKSNQTGDEEDIENLFEGDEEDDETKKSNQDGDSEDALLAGEEALKVFNKRVGKNYKSWDEVSKREQTVDEFYAKGGKEKQGEKKLEKKAEEKPSNVIKNLFFNANPEAKEVWDEVEKAAKLTGRDPFDLYTDETFLQEKAKAKFEERKAEEEAKLKVSDPSNGSRPSSSTDWSKLTDEEVADLPTEKYEKYSQWRKSQSKSDGFIFH